MADWTPEQQRAAMQAVVDLARELCPCGHDGCAASLLGHAAGILLFRATYPGDPRPLLDGILGAVICAHNAEVTQAREAEAAAGPPPTRH